MTEQEQKAAVLAAYRETGTVHTACARVGIPTLTLFRWTGSDMDYNREMRSVCAELIAECIAEASQHMYTLDGDS